MEDAKKPNVNRDVTLQIRVTKSGADALKEAAAKRNLSVSDAHREALKEWTVRNR